LLYTSAHLLILFSKQEEIIAPVANLWNSSLKQKAFLVVVLLYFTHALASQDKKKEKKKK